jgi:hypothetical protein
MSYLRYFCLFVGGPMSYLRYFCLFVGGPMSYLRYFYLFVEGPMSYLRYFCLVVGGPMSYLRYFCLFVEGPMSYLRYFCLVAYSGVQHILCCVFLPLFWLPHRFILHVNGFKKLRKFEGTKGVIRSRQSKEDRQQNDKKHIRQKMIYKTLHSKLKIEWHEPY